MASKRTLKRASKSTSLRAQSAASKARELEQIEDLLGEDFETLAQARAALARETTKSSAKPSSKSTPKSSKKSTPLPSKSNATKRVYTIRELKPNEKQTINAFLNDKPTAELIQKSLLKPGELWGATTEHRYTGVDAKTHTGTARTWHTYHHIGDLFKKLSNYITYGRFGSARTRDNFINSISVLRFGKSASIKDASKVRQQNALEWNILKRDEVQERLKRKRKLLAMIRRGERSIVREAQMQTEIRDLQIELTLLKKRKG